MHLNYLKMLKFKPHLKNCIIWTKKISLFILSFLFLSNANLISQDQTTTFEYLTINEGLSSNRIYCIYRDSKDYLWIATDLGLDRYDSDRIKSYRFNGKNPGSISSNNVRTIFEDSNGNLWFGTDNGLNLYDRKTDSFKKFFNDENNIASLNHNLVKSIIEDGNHDLWILTNGDCLNRWDPVNKNFTRFLLGDNGAQFDNTATKMMSLDSKGNIWISSYNRGVIRFDPQTGENVRYDDPSFDFGMTTVKSIYVDENDMVWVGSRGNGLFSFNPSNKKFEQYGFKGGGTGTNTMSICDIIPDGDRYLLLGVDQGGINRFDKTTKTFEYIQHKSSSPQGLNNNGIWCLFKDKEDILWVGTSAGGINYYNPKKEKFRHFTNKGDINSLSYNSILCFYEDHEGKIWIGTDGGGVNIYDPINKTFTAYKNNPLDPYSISGDAVLCIVEDKDYNIWLGTWDAGLNKFDRKTGKFYNYQPDFNNPSAISGKNVWSLAVDHNNNLWIGQFGIGIDLFDTKKGVIKRFFPDNNNPNTIHSSYLYSFYEDEENDMWIGTSGGLSRYDNKTGSIIRYALPETYLSTFLMDGKDKIWVGTSSNGLYHFNLNGSLIKSYSVTEGLADNSIRGIMKGDNNDLWIPTANGLSHLDLSTQTFRNYTKKDGLQANEFHLQTFLKTTAGEIYVGGYNGFNAFNPRNLKENDFLSPVYITDFQIFNKSVDIGGQNSQFPTDINESKEIELTWKQSVFSFYFNAINYTFPINNQYAYMLEGFDTEWNYTDASRKYVSYTNLDKGTYTFKVKASNNDGVWNEDGMQLTITILPAWWETIGFNIIMVILILLLLFLFYRYKVQSLRDQKKLLEKTVDLKTAELRHINSELKETNRSKDKFFSIIAHDLRGPLSAFVGATELLSDDFQSMDQNEINEITVSMKKSAKNIYDLLENLLEWSRLMRGTMAFAPESLDLKKSVEECIAVLYPSINKKNISFCLAINWGTTVEADKHMLSGIVRNLVSNAIKFTPKGGKITLSAKPQNNDIVTISVEDTGIGMSEELKNRIFILSEKTGRPGTEGEPSAGLGLMLCKEFIQKHGGTIWVESEIGKGSSFNFTLPLISEPTGKS